jgi:hypothetical protein
MFILLEARKMVLRVRGYHFMKFNHLRTACLTLCLLGATACNSRLNSLLDSLKKIQARDLTQKSLSSPTPSDSDTGGISPTPTPTPSSSPSTSVDLSDININIDTTLNRTAASASFGSIDIYNINDAQNVIENLRLKINSDLNLNTAVFSANTSDPIVASQLNRNVIFNNRLGTETYSKKLIDFLPPTPRSNYVDSSGVLMLKNLIIIENNATNPITIAGVKLVDLANLTDDIKGYNVDKVSITSGANIDDYYVVYGGAYSSDNSRSNKVFIVRKGSYGSTTYGATAYSMNINTAPATNTKLVVGRSSQTLHSVIQANPNQYSNTSLPLSSISDQVLIGRKAANSNLIETIFVFPVGSQNYFSQTARGIIAVPAAPSVVRDSILAAAGPTFQDPVVLPSPSPSPTPIIGVTVSPSGALPNSAPTQLKLIVSITNSTTTNSVISQQQAPYNGTITGSGASCFTLVPPTAGENLSPPRCTNNFALSSAGSSNGLVQCQYPYIFTPSTSCSGTVSSSILFYTAPATITYQTIPISVTVDSGLPPQTSPGTLLVSFSTSPATQSPAPPPWKANIDSPCNSTPVSYIDATLSVSGPNNVKIKKGLFQSLSSSGTTYLPNIANSCQNAIITQSTPCTFRFNANCFVQLTTLSGQVKFEYYAIPSQPTVMTTAPTSFIFTAP